METVTANPLCWPNHQQRTPERQRKWSSFGTKKLNGYGRSPLTIAQARDRVLDELNKFTKVGRAYRVTQLIISSDLKFRQDGLPYSSQKTPADPGVAVYFFLDDVQRVMASDSYLSIAENLAAIAATLSALRTIERHGSQMFEAAFTGFTALPSPDKASSPNWRLVLNYYGNDLTEAKHAYRIARKNAHPDSPGGNATAFQKVVEAWVQAESEFSN